MAALRTHTHRPYRLLAQMSKVQWVRKTLTVSVAIQPSTVP